MKKIGKIRRVMCALFGIVTSVTFLIWAFITCSGLWHAMVQGQTTGQKIGLVCMVVVTTLPMWILNTIIGGVGLVAMEQAVRGRE